MATYHGRIHTPSDAIILFEACRLGWLPQVRQRLSQEERRSIKSGSIFVWEEQEAGMRRWTDGKLWSSSRVSGRFLIYHEMKGKHGGGKITPLPAQPVEKTEEEYKIRKDGLIKQSFSIKTSNGKHLHLISYYSRPHLESSELPRPTTDPQLRQIVPNKNIYVQPTAYRCRESVMEGESMQPSLYIQPPYEQLQMYGSPGQCERVSSSHRHSRSYTWPPSPVTTPPPRFQSLYRSQPGSQYTSPCLPYQTLPDRSTPPPLDLLLSSPSPPLSIDLGISCPSNLLPPVDKVRRESTLSQDYESSQAWTPQPTSRAASPNDVLKSYITVSRGRSVSSTPSLVHTIGPVSEMSNNTRNRSLSKSESPIENGERRLRNIFARKKLNTWVEDRRMIRVLDGKFVF